MSNGYTEQNLSEIYCKFTVNFGWMAVLALSREPSHKGRAEHGETLKGLLVYAVEGRKALAVYVDHCCHTAVLEHGHHNLRTRARGASYVARELLHVGHHEGSRLLPRRAAHASALAYGVARHRALEGAETQVVALNKIEPHPKIMWEGVLEQSAEVGQCAYAVGDTRHEALGLGKGGGIGLLLVGGRSK